MIITKTPLRIPICGGGTDLPVWYKEHGSMFISAAIDKFIYITLHHSEFSEKIRCRYSIMEEVDNVDQIQNDIIRETCKGRVKNSIEITSHAEIPSGTGLGSSGSFGVGVLQALEPYWNAYELGKEATRIQMNMGAPIGWQDQMIAAEGGVRRYVIKQDGFIRSEGFNAEGLDEKLVMFFTGIKRDANEVLKKSSTEGLAEVQSLAYTMQEALESKEYDLYGKLLNIHWEQKKRRGVSNPEIDSYYRTGMENGALGGKLIGAGGGGFLLFYTNDKERLIRSMPLKHIDFKFYSKGSEVLHE